MGFILKWLQSLWSAPPQREHDSYAVADGQEAVWVYVQCDRCGEKIALRLRRSDELQPIDGTEEDIVHESGFYTKKTMVGRNCFQRMDGVFLFNERYEFVNADIVGGRLLTKAQYDDDGAESSQDSQ